FSPMPLTSIRSSTRAKAPCAWRYSTIRSATFEPIRGRLARSLADAWLILIFLPAAASDVSAAAASPDTHRRTPRVIAARPVFRQFINDSLLEALRFLRWLVWLVPVLIGSLRSGVLHRHLLSFRGIAEARVVPAARSGHQPEGSKGFEPSRTSAREAASATEEFARFESSNRQAA